MSSQVLAQVLDLKHFSPLFSEQIQVIRVLAHWGQTHDVEVPEGKENKNKKKNRKERNKEKKMNDDVIKRAVVFVLLIDDLQ